MSTEATTVDENNIAVKCTSLQALTAEYKLKLSKIEDTYQILRSIQRTEDGVNPLDTRTGRAMTDTTRLEIYNAAVATASELLEIARTEREYSGPEEPDA